MGVPAYRSGVFNVKSDRLVLDAAIKGNHTRFIQHARTKEEANVFVSHVCLPGQHYEEGWYHVAFWTRTQIAPWEIFRWPYCGAPAERAARPLPVLSLRPPPRSSLSFPARARAKADVRTPAPRFLAADDPDAAAGMFLDEGESEGAGAGAGDQPQRKKQKKASRKA